MCRDSKDHIFNYWLKKSLHDQFGHVDDEPVPEIIERELNKLTPSDPATMRDND